MAAYDEVTYQQSDPGPGADRDMWLAGPEGAQRPLSVPYLYGWIRVLREQLVERGDSFTMGAVDLPEVEAIEEVLRSLWQLQKEAQKEA
jgi:hypothetical protein